MLFEDINLAWRVRASSLKAATAIDRVRRRVDNDVAPILAFVDELEAVYGVAPTSVREAINERNVDFLERLQSTAFDIHESADRYRMLGPFSDDEFDEMLANSVPLSADLIARIDALVGDTVVDLDEPIDGEVAV